MSDDIVVASTTDTPEEIEAALTHGTEEKVGEAVLSTEVIDDKKPDEGKVDDKPAGDDKKPAEKVDEKKPEGEKKPEDGADGKKPAAGEKKPDEKAAEAKDDKPEPKPKREDFKGEKEWSDALVSWGARKRIDKLTAKNTAEKERADAAEAETARLRRENEELKAGSKKAPAADDKKVERAADKPEPKAEDFETHELWLAELARYHAAVATEKATEEVRRQAADDAAATEVREAERKFVERQKVAKDRYPDIDTVMEGARAVELNGVEQYVIMTSEVGPDIAYYLAKPENRAEAQRLFEMTGPNAILAMGRLEEKVSRQVDAIRQAAIDESEAAETDGAAEHEAAPVKKKAVTKAEEPIDPLGAGRSAGQRKSLDEIQDQREYNRRRNEEELRRKKNR